jgi:hypothetical protein
LYSGSFINFSTFTSHNVHGKKVSQIDQVTLPKQVIVTLLMKFPEFDVLWLWCGTSFEAVYSVFPHLSFYHLCSL